MRGRRWVLRRKSGTESVYWADPQSGGRCVPLAGRARLSAVVSATASGVGREYRASLCLSKELKQVIREHTQKPQHDVQMHLGVTPHPNLLPAKVIFESGVAP